MVNILVVDDHAVVRSGVKQFLASTDDLRIVAEAATGEHALAQLRAQSCDLVLLDLRLPDLGGMEVLRRIKAGHPALPVLVFSMFSEDEFALPVLQAGASGYLCKDSAPEQILLALRTVATGGRYISPALAEKLLDGTACPGRREPHEALSAREMEVLLDLSRGMSLTRIGDQLHLSVKTVSTYRARILEKLHVASNAEITRYVLEHRLG